MKFIILALVCLFALPAQAALTLENDVLSARQVSTIKGFIYEAYRAQDKKEQKKILQSIAASLEWVERAHKSKKKHDVLRLTPSPKTTPLIIAVTYIVQMINDPQYSHNPHIKEHYLQLWTDRGSRLRIVSKTKKGKKVYSALLITEKKEIKKNENSKK